MILIGNNLYADDGKWLYQDEGEQRMFWQSITLAKPENAQYFSECTQSEKEAWEAEHAPQVEDIEPDEQPE